MKKNLYYILYIGILVMFLAGCQDDALFMSVDEERACVSYRVKVEDELQSRAIGDAAQLNNLTVVVFDQANNLVLRQDGLDWDEVQVNGVSLPLFNGTYSVLFWLQYAGQDLKPYTIADNGKVSVSYANWTGNINDVEKWDAFYVVDKLTINNAVQSKLVKLTRPLGQLNWATQDEFDPAEHQVVVTLKHAATTFNPLSPTDGNNAQSISGNEITLIFNDFTTEKLTTDEGVYKYLSCSYLFPATLSVAFDLQNKEGTSLKKVEINDNQIGITSNKRTNILGSIAQESETSDTEI